MRNAPIAGATLKLAEVALRLAETSSRKASGRRPGLTQATMEVVHMATQAESKSSTSRRNLLASRHASLAN
jgi:hypothetical protein